MDELIRLLEPGGMLHCVDLSSVSLAARFLKKKRPFQGALQFVVEGRHHCSSRC